MPGVLLGLGQGPVPDVAIGDAGQTGLITAGGRREVPFSTTTNQAVCVIDCSNYRWIAIQFTTFGGGTASFQASNDGVNWNVLQLGLTNAAIAGNTATATGMYAGPLHCRYFRVNVTGISGTIAGVAEFFAIAGVLANQTGNVGINGNVTIQAASPADGVTGNGTSAPSFAPLVFNGATWDRPRTPTTFKSASITASGNTAVWTPTSGKKFRLMRFIVMLTADAATSGGAEIDITFQDSTTDLGFKASCFVPAVAGTAFGNGFSSGWIDWGNGKLSALANNVLNGNLSAALTSGKCTIHAIGTEE